MYAKFLTFSTLAVARFSNSTMLVSRVVGDDYVRGVWRESALGNSYFNLTPSLLGYGVQLQRCTQQDIRLVQGLVPTLALPKILLLYTLQTIVTMPIPGTFIELRSGKFCVLFPGFSSHYFPGAQMELAF